MIKKILSVLLILYFFTAILHAQDNVKIKFWVNDITATRMYNQEKYLIDKVFYIKEGSSFEMSKDLIEWTDRVDISRKINQPGSDLFIGPNKVTVTCKDNSITWVDTTPKEPFKSLYVKFTDNIDGNPNNRLEYYLQIKCKVQANKQCNLWDDQIRNNPLSSLEIKEKDIYTNSNLENFPISSKYIEIPENDARDKLMKPKPDLQPKFIEIIYHQINTIDRLTDSLQSLWVDIDTLLTDSSNCGYYTQWLTGFTDYNNVQSFADDFDSAITLKDIGIADNIANTLSARLLCEYKTPGTCNQKINIVKTWQFEFYTLEEILYSIYGWTDSTSANMKSLYEELKPLKDNNYDEITNPAEKSFVSKVMTDTLWDMSEYNDFAIWYGIKTRINNIDSLKSTFESSSDEARVNIRWVYNFYYEIANASKWYSKTIALEKAIGSENLETAIKETAIQDIKNNLSLFGDDYDISDMDHDILTWNIMDDLQTLLRINEEDFTLSLIWCTVWDTIGSFLNYDKILTEYDYYNLLEWLISKAYSSTNKKITETPDSLYSEGLYSIEGKNNVSIYLSDITSEAWYKNTFGYYFADSEKKPLSGKIIFEQINRDTNINTISLSIISSEIPTNAAYIWFWLWANAYDKSSFIKNGDIITFKSTGWEINGRIVETQESDNSIFFSHSLSNIDDREQMQKEGNSMNWEDGWNNSFDDLIYNSNILISDYYSIYLDMPALKDTVYEKYFDIQDCYNPIDDPNLILYYNSDSFLDGGSLIDNLAGDIYNGYSVNGSITPTSGGLYFGGGDYIRTRQDLPIGDEITIEIKADITSLNDQIIWEYGTSYEWMSFMIKDEKIILWGWNNETCHQDASGNLIWSWREFGETNIDYGIHIFKITLWDDWFKLYKNDDLVIENSSNNAINFSEVDYFWQGGFKFSIWANENITRFNKILDTTKCEIINWWYYNNTTEIEVWKLTTENVFQWTIEYIKIWNIVKE